MIHFIGTPLFRLKEDKIVEEVGLDDDLTTLQQLGMV